MAKAKNEAKIKFTAETGDFNDSIKEANREMAELRAELKFNEAEMKATGNTVDGLHKKYGLLQDQLEKAHDKTEALNEKVKKAEEIFGENSEEASRLRIQLKNAQTAEERLKASINDVNDELKGQKGATKDAGDGFTVFKGVVADLASSAIQGAISKLSEFTSYLAQLPQETMEFRQDISTLTTSFDHMGFSTKTAKETWKDLYAIFGEDDRAVEASNLIAKMADDQKDLNDWTTITTGVWARYQDSLPVEGLAETAMETAKTGQLTGTLVDALVWAGESEEGFQKKLDACSTEQERQALITETLMGLYGESAETYRDTSDAQMKAKEAAAEHMQVQAELAESIEPVTTEFTNLKTELLEGAKPAIEKVSGVLLDALEWMKEHPTTVKAVGAAVGVLAIGFTGLAIAMGIYAAAQWAANLALMPFALPIAGIVVGIALLVGAGVALAKNWDKITAKAKELWTNVKTYFSNLKTSAVNKINEMKKSVTDKFDSIKTSAINKFDALKEGILKPINTAKTKVESIVKKIKGLFDFQWKLPSFKVPKINVKGGKAPWGILGKGTPPSFSIKWNAAGAVVTKPTLVGAVGNTIMGAGEAGAEAILPISVLQDYINRAFDRNVLAYAVAGGTGDVYNFYVNDAKINDNAKMREVAKDFVTELVRLGGMNR